MAYLQPLPPHIKSQNTFGNFITALQYFVIPSLGYICMLNEYRKLWINH